MRKIPSTCVTSTIQLPVPVSEYDVTRLAAVRSLVADDGGSETPHAKSSGVSLTQRLLERYKGHRRGQNVVGCLTSCYCSVRCCSKNRVRVDKSN